jgi:methyl-accepting chemotaxis protein
VTEPAGIDPSTPGGPAVVRGSRLGFRTRITLALVAAAVLPVAGFGLVVLLIAGSGRDADTTLTRILLFALALAVVFGVLLAALLAADLGAPLRALSRSVDRVTAGDLGTRLELPGDDELSRLADSHNRLACAGSATRSARSRSTSHPM